MKRLLLLIAFMAILSAASLEQVQAQRISAKTNLVGLATLSPNLAIDLAVTRRVSVEFGASYNSWGGIDALHESGETASIFQKRHVSFDSNLKYWFARPFNGHAAMAGIKVGTYNYDIFGLRHLYGESASVGVGYGYTHVCTPRSNIEFAVMAGMALMSETKSNSVPPVITVRPMIHRVGISYVYVIK